MTATGGVKTGDGSGSVLGRTIGNLLTWAGVLVRPGRIPARRSIWRPAGRVVLGVVLAVVAVTAAMVVLDAWAINNQRELPRWLVATFDEITDFGRSGWFLVPTGVLLLAIAALASRALGRITYLVLVSMATRLGFVFVAVGLTGLVVTVVKRLIGRARPMHFDETGPFTFAPFAWRVDFASLPSGHGTTAFAAAVAIGALYPRTRAVMWIFAAIIALSRVAIAAHYPSDVIAGAAVGAAGALIVRRWFAARRLGFSIGTDGAVRALPGPSLQRIKKVARRLAGQ